jgi:DNA-binding GntR family transcriptional regulator
VESLAIPKKLVDQAYAAMLDAICNGTLKPGERLTQDSVAQRLNVSRQPVHNALLLLRAQGFVRDVGRRGLAVAPLDAKLFDAIYQFRSAVEPLAVRLAITRLDREAKERGRALIAHGRAVAGKRDARRLVEADMAFHSFLYELSDNSLILETMRLNWHHLRRAMGEVLRHPGLARRVWKEHEKIFESMLAGNADEAALLMRDHIVLAHKDVGGVLRAGLPGERDR